MSRRCIQLLGWLVWTFVATSATEHWDAKGLRAPHSSKETVSVTASNEDIREVLIRVIKQSGRKPVLNNVPKVSVTCSLTRVELKTALDVILGSTKSSGKPLAYNVYSDRVVIKVLPAKSKAPKSRL